MGIFNMIYDTVLTFFADYSAKCKLYLFNIEDNEYSCSIKDNGLYLKENEFLSGQIANTL